MCSKLAAVVKTTSDSFAEPTGGNDAYNKKRSKMACQVLRDVAMFVHVAQSSGDADSKTASKATAAATAAVRNILNDATVTTLAPAAKNLATSALDILNGDVPSGGRKRKSGHGAPDESNGDIAAHDTDEGPEGQTDASGKKNASKKKASKKKQKK